MQGNTDVREKNGGTDRDNAGSDLDKKHQFYLMKMTMQC